MKKFITFLLSFLSPLAAAPTGWAIYAGVTEQPAFPMWKPAAVIGALAVISTTAAAGMLIVDILKHNSEAKDADEQKMNLPAWYGWAILAGCTTAEIILSLLIVVFSDALKWGVLAFPLVTIAGVFALAVRMTLQERITDRTNSRAQQAQALADEKAKAETDKEKAKAERKERRTAKKSAAVQAPSIEPVAQSAAGAPQSVATPSKYPRRCEHCAADAPDSVALLKSSNAVGGHMKKHHPDLCKKTEKLVGSFFQNVAKETK